MKDITEFSDKLILTIFILIILLFFFILIFFIIKIFFNSNQYLIKFKKLTLTFKKNEKQYQIQEIVNAIKFLSNKKIGASFVFERKHDISPLLVSKGIKIDSLVSSDLISVIFAYKQCQLHDGAMIIDNKLKIKTAGVFLPIKKYRLSNKKFGSRHISIQTITTISDAIGIVISETSGSIIGFVGKKTTTLKTEDFNEISNWLKKLLD